MIAVDTSALMAILLNEPAGDACAQVLKSEAEVVISAATLAEALIVATRRGIAEEMSRLIEEIDLTVAAVDRSSARRAAEAYTRWGKGVSRARLNFGDCFAYEVATTHACPLLFVGEDFPLTDVASALGG